MQNWLDGQPNHVGIENLRARRLCNILDVACMSVVSARHRCTCPMIAAKAAKPSAAPMPASVPSALMAPSVPLGTLLRVVTRYVVWPYACAV